MQNLAPHDAARLGRCRLARTRTIPILEKTVPIAQPRRPDRSLLATLPSTILRGVVAGAIRRPFKASAGRGRNVLRSNRLRPGRLWTALLQRGIPPATPDCGLRKEGESQNATEEPTQIDEFEQGTRRHGGVLAEVQY